MSWRCTWCERTDHHGVNCPTQVDSLVLATQQCAELAEALRDVLAFRLENGVHYCRGCSAGTHQGWVHEAHCRYAESERVSANARAALAKYDATKGPGNAGQG